MLMAMFDELNFLLYLFLRDLNDFRVHRLSQPLIMIFKLMKLYVPPSPSSIAEKKYFMHQLGMVPGTADNGTHELMLE